MRHIQVMEAPFPIPPQMLAGYSYEPRCYGKFTKVFADHRAGRGASSVCLWAWDESIVSAGRHRSDA